MRRQRRPYSLIYEERCYQSLKIPTGTDRLLSDKHGRKRIASLFRILTRFAHNPMITGSLLSEIDQIVTTYRVEGYEGM